MEHEQVRSYDPVLKSLHWIMAFIILSIWSIGFIMEDLPKGPFRGEVFDLHKALGVVVFLLAVLRILWRTSHAVPALPPTLTSLEKAGATWAHRLLYVLMIVLPVNGVLMTQVHGRTVSVFGFFTLPTLLAENEELEEILEAMHTTLAMTLAALVAIHVAAALRHYFILKDDVLKRMTFGLSK